MSFIRRGEDERLHYGSFRSSSLVWAWFYNWCITVVVKPALTAEKWEFEIGRRYFEILQANPQRCHADAAMCLYGQPFGFTREDVRRHRNSAILLQEQLDRQGSKPTWDFPFDEIESAKFQMIWHISMANRIEALLPPEEES